MTKNIEEGFLDLVKVANPGLPTDSDQYKDIRKYFLCGAAHMWDLVNRATIPEDEGKCESLLKVIQRELDQIGVEIMSDAAAFLAKQQEASKKPE